MTHPRPVATVADPLSFRAGAAALAMSAGAFLLFSPNAAHAQIHPDLVQRALSEARKSDPETREAVLGTVEVYQQLPPSVKGGDSVPATKGHPFSTSPMVTAEQRENAETVVMPLMTIFRDADHQAPEALVESSRMFEKHMATLPVPKHLNDKLGHIKKCPACAAHVSHMIYQHEVAVASAPLRGVVLFHTGDSELTSRARAEVRDFAITVRNHPRARVCLIGRASRIGGWQYNRVLSERRTDAVAGALRIHGVPGEKITTLWLGFDAPQLNPVNTAKYGFRPLYESAGCQQMNQSVLMVLYLDHDEGGPGPEPAPERQNRFPQKG